MRRPHRFRKLSEPPASRLVRAVMTHADEPLTVDPDGGRDQHVHRARRSDVRKLLETFAALGHGEATDDEKYAT